MFFFRAASILLVCLGCLSAGCQAPYKITSLFNRQRSPEGVAQVSDQTVSTPAPVVLNAGMEVQWRVQTAQEQPGQVRGGRGMIGPDGTVEIGPYGTCKVSGMTLDQATLALEQHLAAYIKSPSVQLSATGPTSQAEVAWRPARTSSPSTLARSGGATAVNETAIEPVVMRR